MRVPKVKPRRNYDRKAYPGYLESDNDFVDNNLRAAVWFLENRDKIVAALKHKEVRDANEPKAAVGRREIRSKDG